MPYFLLTTDVELFSISLNREDPSIAEEIDEVGLPRLLELYSKYGVETTFFFTANIVELKPELVEMVKAHGHEVGCHGYSHNPKEAFDILSYDRQVKILQKAKRIIEDAGAKVKAFRAPEARINKDTVKALETTGFTTDSSVCPQRFDGPFSYGFWKKTKWLVAPRKPYFLSYSSTVRRGNSNILEIPISALIFPFIGTTMRISPTVTRMLQRVLFFESKKTNRPIVFLFHPNECLDLFPEKQLKSRRWSNRKIRNWFADDIRTRLKLRNMGEKAIKLLSEILSIAKKEGFEFKSVTSYRQIYERRKI